MVKKVDGVITSKRGPSKGFGGRRPVGRPEGSVSGYTLSPAALAQRKAAPLVHGGRSAILSKYMSKESSPLPLLVSDEDVGSLRKELYLHYLSQGLEEPALLAMDTLAALRVEMDLERARADSEGEVLSKRWLEAATLADKMTSGLAKLKHGSKQTIEVKQMKGFFDLGADDVVIDIPADDDGDDGE